MNQIKLQLFFDESGTKDAPTLMGGLSVAETIYASTDFTMLTQRLRDKQLNLHWSEYGGYSTHRQNITEAIEMAMRYFRLLKFNAINYYKPDRCDTTLFRKAFYTKLPERILYGLLRGYGKGTRIEADIKIEFSHEYQSANLKDLIKEQLNIQSLYRGEQFSICDSQLVPKNQEIGVELTDLILGMVRTIIINRKDGGKGSQERNKLVLHLINSNPNFYTFLCGIKYFEWTGKSELSEVDFAEYLRVFLSTQHT